MKEKLSWFRRLPFRVSLSLFLMYILRRILRLPIDFYFATSGDDVLLQFLLPKSKGFYIDVGCNRPIRFSNTFKLYMSGWRGVVIDINAELIKKFKKIRKEDYTVCAAIAEKEKKSIFYKSQTSAVSTLSEENYEKIKYNWNFYEKDQTEITTYTLTSILDRIDLLKVKIDLLSIDVEGYDLNVLKGLDFAKYTPEIIIVEIHKEKIIDLFETEIYQFLISKSYELINFSISNAYFKRKC